MSNTELAAQDVSEGIAADAPAPERAAPGTLGLLNLCLGVALALSFLLPTIAFAFLLVAETLGPEMLRTRPGYAAGMAIAYLLPLGLLYAAARVTGLGRRLRAGRLAQVATATANVFLLLHTAVNVLMLGLGGAGYSVILLASVVLMWPGLLLLAAGLIGCVLGSLFPHPPAPRANG